MAGPPHRFQSPDSLRGICALLDFMPALFLAVRLAGLVRCQPLQFLGTSTCAIFILHIFIEARLEDGFRQLARRGGPDQVVTEGDTGHLGRRPMDGMLFALLMLALVIIASHFADGYIAQPGIRLGRRLFGEQRRAPT
jgi:peptidoglycan/LPS O-acetylase OafA/YrhL